MAAAATMAEKSVELAASIIDDMKRGDFAAASRKAATGARKFPEFTPPTKKQGEVGPTFAQMGEFLLARKLGQDQAPAPASRVESAPRKAAPARKAAPRKAAPKVES